MVFYRQSQNKELNMINNANRQNVINNAFDYLSEIGVCDTQAEFSREWLQQSENYFAYLRSTNAEPSLNALSCLATRLTQTSWLIRHTADIDANAYQCARRMCRLGIEAAAALFGARLRETRSADSCMRAAIPKSPPILA